MRSYEWKSALGLTILFMILMRLVWMDIRTYPPFYPPQNRVLVAASSRADVCIRSFDLRQKQALVRSEEWVSRPSWGGSLVYEALVHASCRSQSFDEQVFIRYNQGFLISLVFFAALMTRILSRSWIIALVVAVSLLSRGRLIASNGNVSPELAMSSLVMLWAACLSHWLRSGSRIVLFGSNAVAAFLASLEPSFTLLLLILPVLHLIFHQRLASFLAESNTATEIQSGHVFRPLTGGLGRLLERPDSRKQVVHDLWRGALVGFVLLIALSLPRTIDFNPKVPYWTGGAYLQWWQVLIQPLDRDLGLAILLAFLTIPARSFVPVRMRSLLVVISLAFGVSLLSCAVLDRIYLSGTTARHWLGPSMLLIWEPLILTLGILSFLFVFFELFQRFWLSLQSRDIKGEE